MHIRDVMSTPNFGLTGSQWYGMNVNAAIAAKMEVEETRIRSYDSDWTGRHGVLVVVACLNRLPGAPPHRGVYIAGH